MMWMESKEGDFCLRLSDRRKKMFLRQKKWTGIKHKAFTNSVQIFAFPKTSQSAKTLANKNLCLKILRRGLFTKDVIKKGKRSKIQETTAICNKSEKHEQFVRRMKKKEIFGEKVKC